MPWTECIQANEYSAINSSINVMVNVWLNSTVSHFNCWWLLKFCTSSDSVYCSHFILRKHFQKWLLLSSCSSRRSTCKKRDTEEVTRNDFQVLAFLCLMKNFIVRLKRNNDSSFVCLCKLLKFMTKNDDD